MVTERNGSGFVRLGMKVLLSGAGGLVGKALAADLTACGIEVRSLQRRRIGTELWWDPQTGETNASGLSPDAFIHLAGENIAGRRWNAEQKTRIAESRIAATERLVRSLLEWRTLPSVFIGASAIGYYGDRGGEELTEQSAVGHDFLADVCQRWEAAAEPLLGRGVRVVHLRFGMILSRSGGALTRMLPVFRLGLGGKLGEGKQWMSWIALSDVIQVIHWALANPQARGAYNVVAPNPITNDDFTQTLGHVLNRPAFFRVPTAVLRTALGEMANALLLTSQRALPTRLLAEGFKFQYPNLEAALRRELKQ